MSFYDAYKKTKCSYTQAIYESFLLSLIVAWQPVKVIGYAAPLLCIIWFIFRSGSGDTLIRFVKVFVLCFIVIGIYFLLSKVNNNEFSIQNSLLSILTYSSFIPLLVISTRAVFEKTLQSKITYIIGWIILIQSCLGITQAVLYVILNGGSFDSATGDVVQGTLSPLSFIMPSGNFNNQIYSSNLLVLILFYLPYVITQRKGILITGLGIFAVLLASVMHQVIAFMAVLIITSTLFSASFFKINLSKVLIAIGIIASGFLFAFLQPKNVELISFYAKKITNNDSPKSKVTIESLTKLPYDYPQVYFIGLGPGQYCSRAGLIGTGKYFGDFKNPKNLPLLTETKTPALDKYIYKKWEEVATNVPKYGNSTMARPFYSALAIFIEFGFLVSVLFIFFILKKYLKLQNLYKAKYHSGNKRDAYSFMASAVLILYYLSLSFFENYLEVSQVIFCGLFLYKMINQTENTFETSA
jgi:hypothetical protein